MTPEQRVLRAQLAAHSRWARTPDRQEATAAARAAFMDRFERQVDPDRKLSPEKRALLAESARAAYFRRLALSSSTARSARRAS